MTPARSPLQPPVDLSPRMLEVWHQTIDGMPAGWFSCEHIPLLSEYCKYVVQSEEQREMLPGMHLFDDYVKLVRIMSVTSANIRALARSMRITHQAQVRAESAGATGIHGVHGRSGASLRLLQTSVAQDLVQASDVRRNAEREKPGKK